MRAIWKGAVSFGLVSIGVKMFSATEERDISFHSGIRTACQIRQFHSSYRSWRLPPRPASDVGLGCKPKEHRE